METNNENSVAIITFCSNICVGEVQPLSNQEWDLLAKLLVSRGKEPRELLGYLEEDFVKGLGISVDYAKRLFKLLNRSVSLFFELSKYENMGIKVLTRADKTFPKELKRELSDNCPALLYYVGDVELLNNRRIETIVINSGINTDELENELSMGNFIIELTNEPILKKLKSSKAIKAIQNGKLLIISPVAPNSTKKEKIENIKRYMEVLAQK